MLSIAHLKWMFCNAQLLCATCLTCMAALCQQYVPAARHRHWVACMVQANGVEVVNAIASDGNRSDVRAVTLSDTDGLLLSTGNGGTKLWNAHSGACLNDIATGYGLSALFAPGGRYAVVGCKDGYCDIIDIGMADVVERVEAHSSQVRFWTHGKLFHKCAVCVGACCCLAQPA
jgi:WD40 repeat protein